MGVGVLCAAGGYTPFLPMASFHISVTIHVAILWAAFLRQALRVFVESVLRFGLPVDFMSAIVMPHKKASKRLRVVLQQLYGSLAGGCLLKGEHMNNGSSVEFYPYVCLTICPSVPHSGR